MVTVVAVLAAGILSQSGCGRAGDSGDGETLSVDPEPLRVRRGDSKTESITFAQAMAWHHRHEEKEPEHAAGSEDAEHDHGLCIGVAAGYQAIRYAATQLFPDETPRAEDLEMSLAGNMPGVWDMLELYAGRSLPRPTAGHGQLSRAQFRFTAVRTSTSRKLFFQIREGLIPQEFFDMKNRGATCENPELNHVKKEAALRVLSISPQECFDPVGENERAEHPQVPEQGTLR
jgi:hypothetical protein